MTNLWGVKSQSTVRLAHYQDVRVTSVLPLAVGMAEEVVTGEGGMKLCAFECESSGCCGVGNTSACWMVRLPTWCMRVCFHSSYVAG